MSFLNLPKRFHRDFRELNRKPIRDVTPNDGLSLRYLFDLNSNFIDLVQGLNLPNGSHPPFISTKNGIATNHPIGSTYSASNSSVLAEVGTTYTVVFTSTGTGNQDILMSHTGITIRRRDYSNEAQASVNVGGHIGVTLNGISPINDGKMHVVSVVIKDLSHSYLYVDGALEASSESTTLLLSSSTGKLELGSASVVSWIGQIHAVAIAGRPWTSAESALVGKDPFRSLFKPKRPALYVVPAVTGGSAVSADSSLNWNLLNAIQSDSALQWSLLNTIQSDSSLYWSLLNSISADSDLKWSIIQAILNDSTLSWDIQAAISAVQGDLTAQWNVLSSIENNSDLQWSILNTISADSNLRWSLLNAISIDAELRWSLLNSITGDSDLRWSLLNSISGDASLQWNIDSSLLTVSSDISLQWSIIAAVQQSLTAQWNLFNAVTSEADLKWSLLGAIAQDLTAQWSLLGGVSSSADIRWSVIAATDNTLRLRWSIESENSFPDLEGVITVVSNTPKISFSSLTPIITIH